MRPLHNAKKNSASNQGTGQYDGKKRIDSVLLPVLAFPFSRFPITEGLLLLPIHNHVCSGEAIVRWRGKLQNVVYITICCGF